MDSPRILNRRERRLLERLSETNPTDDYHISGQLPSGVGQQSIKGLLELGLIEAGVSKRFPGQPGWRITNDGWRSMYGRTLDEIISSGVKCHELRIWSWPPSDY